MAVTYCDLVKCSPLSSWPTSAFKHAKGDTICYECEPSRLGCIAFKPNGITDQGPKSAHSTCGFTEFT